jgi:hypothetical protein
MAVERVLVLALTCAAVVGCRAYDRDDYARTIEAGAPSTDVPDDDTADVGAPDVVPVTGGCADGTREGLTNRTMFPDVAACRGLWAGPVATAGALCSQGWHVCTGVEPALRLVTYTAATAFAGCFAFDAAQDGGNCFSRCSAAVVAGVDVYSGLDMGAIGAGCPWLFPGASSCITGGRIDGAENSGTGCDYNSQLTGLVCCRN